MKTLIIALLVPICSVGQTVQIKNRGLYYHPYNPSHWRLKTYVYFDSNNVAFLYKIQNFPPIRIQSDTLKIDSNGNFKGRISKISVNDQPLQIAIANQKTWEYFTYKLVRADDLEIAQWAKHLRFDMP